MVPDWFEKVYSSNMKETEGVGDELAVGSPLQGYPKHCVFAIEEPDNTIIYSFLTNAVILIS